MSENFKPCPFCGAKLEKHHTKYRAVSGEYIEEEWFSHPLNDCFLMDLCDWALYKGQSLDKWNRRNNNG